jgi:transcriptional regulator with XRE-family HTH domain
LDLRSPGPQMRELRGTHRQWRNSLPWAPGHTPKPYGRALVRTKIPLVSQGNDMPGRRQINRLRALLQGGRGAPDFAPNGLLSLRGLTIEDLAKKAGLTRTAIYNYLAGTNCPTAKNLRLICAALDIQFIHALEYCTPAPEGRPPREFITVSRPVENFGVPLENTPSQDSGVTAALATGEESAAEETEGAFASELQRLMKEHDPPLGIRGLSISLGMFSYEHARKLYRGISLPSKSITFAIAHYFGVPPDPLYALVKRDQFVREYGDDFACQITDQGLASFVSSWGRLSEMQKKSLLLQLEIFTTQNESN